MKKIVFVIGIMGNGGAERVIANLSNLFSVKKYQIDIITIFGSRQDYQLNKNIKVHPIICKNNIRLLRPIERIFLIRKLIKEINPNVVVSFLADVNVHTILAMKGLGIKLIVSERNDPRNDPQQSWIRKIRDVVYKKVDGIVFQTLDAKKYFDKILSHKTKSEIIENPLKENLPFYEGSNESREFITACRLNPQKNLYLMLDSLKKVNEEGVPCSLKIYGDGPLKKELNQYILDNNLSSIVALCGFEKNIHEKMKVAAGFIISSDYEGISNSMLEALAIGVPVIATDCPVGGARMYIKNGISGYLVPCRNVELLTKAIKDVLSDRENAIQMGKNATLIRDRLAVDVIANKWIEFINYVCGE